MKNIKKIIKYSLSTIAFFISFVLLYFGFAYILPRITIEKELNTKKEIEIYILSNGVHTDLVVPIKSNFYDWSKEIKFINTVAKDTNFKYLAMGWGDKGFYLDTPEWKDLKFSVAFNAAFGLGNTAIHATFYEKMIINERCKKIKISNEQYKRLIDYITSSFQKDKNGHFYNIVTKAVYSKNDAFYEAIGSYSMFHTCNTWANNGLKFCGQRSCLWTPFDTGIFLNYNN